MFFWEFYSMNMPMFASNSGDQFNRFGCLLPWLQIAHFNTFISGAIWFVVLGSFWQGRSALMCRDMVGFLWWCEVNTPDQIWSNPGSSPNQAGSFGWISIMLRLPTLFWPPAMSQLDLDSVNNYPVDQFLEIGHSVSMQALPFQSCFPRRTAVASTTGPCTSC